MVSITDQRGQRKAISELEDKTVKMTKAEKRENRLSKT